MYGFFSKKHGANAIRFLCKPLEYIFPDEIIGRILQGIHALGYVAFILIALYVPTKRWLVVTILGSLLILFWIFGGCILTKAEIYYLKRHETVPGIVMRMLGINITDKQTANIVQTALSIIVLVIPIIVILSNKIISDNKSVDVGPDTSVIGGTI